MHNIKKLYNNVGICVNENNFIVIIETEMFITIKGLTDNNPLAVFTSVITNNPSSKKILRKLSDLFDVKK